MAVQTLSGMTAAQRTILEDKTLERAQYTMQHTRWARRRLFAEREGRKITYTRLTNFSAATTALTEGAAPAGESLSTSVVSLTPDYYGSFIYLSRKLVQTGIFDLVNDDLPNMFGYQAALTADTLCRDVLVAGGTAQIADGVSARTSLTASNILDVEELYNARRTLRKNSALPFPEAGNKYILIAHPDQLYDLMRDSEYQAAALYARERAPENPIFGIPVMDIAGFRIYESENVYIEDGGGAGTVDAYVALAIGQFSYGLAGLGGMLPEHEEGGTETELRPVEIWWDDFDKYVPMRQKCSLAWMIHSDSAVLNANWLLRLETAASKGANT